MNADRKPEGRRQAFGPVVPASTANTIVVLLVKHVACRTHHVVDAVPNVTIAWRGRMVAVATCFGVRQAVAALPCRSAVLGREDAGRRDSNPELFWIARIKNDGVQHQPGNLVGFLTGITVLVGLTIAYLQRDKTDRISQSHFQFQISTFWIGLLMAYTVSSDSVGLARDSMAETASDVHEAHKRT